MSQQPLTLDDDSILAPRRDVRYRMIDGEAVVLRQEVGEAMVLNEVGGRILQLLDGERRLGAIYRVLHEEFDAPLGEITTDCREFVAGLTHLGVLESVSAGTLATAAGG